MTNAAPPDRSCHVAPVPSTRLGMADWQYAHDSTTKQGPSLLTNPSSPATVLGSAVPAADTMMTMNTVCTAPVRHSHGLCGRLATSGCTAYCYSVVLYCSAVCRCHITYPTYYCTTSTTYAAACAAAVFWTVPPWAPDAS